MAGRIILTLCQILTDVSLDTREAVEISNELQVDIRISDFCIQTACQSRKQTSTAHPRAQRSPRREMATSTPTVPAVGGPKLASFDVTPAGPLDAARALSPATGATITPSDEPSPRERFWEARAGAWTGAEGDAAFGSVAPSAKTAAGAEETARGAGLLPRRVADDRETPRVAGVEPDSGTEASAPRAATTAASAGDAAAFLGDAAEEDARSDARSDARAALHATARALDFEPRARDSPTKLAEGKRSEREAARGALLAFLARKAETLRSRRAARGAFAAWRGAARAEPTDTITETRTARLALRAWRLVARVGRARVEADALRSRLAEALAARAVADAGSLLAHAPPRSGRHLSVSGACDSGDSGDSGEASTSASAETERPPYGVLDEKLARWLGVDAVSVPGALRRASFAETTSFEIVTDRPLGSRRGRDDEKTHARKTRLDAMEALTEAAREAEARASALETRAESLETDLYAAAVVWEETERENRLLTERVAAMREDAERMTAALAAAEADAAEAARVATAATAARRDATAFERESARERRRARVDADDAYSRGTSYAHSRGIHTAHAPRRSPVGDEVEELEACAAAMRRSMRRPA